MQGLTTLPPRLRSRLASELLEGETVLYAGSPGQRYSFLSGVPILLFGILWSWIVLKLGLAGVPVLLGEDTGAPDSAAPRLLGLAFGLFWIPFAVAGARLLLTPFIYALQARSTVYAVTGRRIIILHGTTGGVESIPAAAMTSAKRKTFFGAEHITIEHHSRGGPQENQQPVIVRWQGLPDAAAAMAALEHLIATGRASRTRAA